MTPAERSKSMSKRRVLEMLRAAKAELIALPDLVRAAAADLLRGTASMVLRVLHVVLHRTSLVLLRTQRQIAWTSLDLLLAAARLDGMEDLVRHQLRDILKHRGEQR